MPECTNSTLLKEKLLTQIPDLQAHKIIHEVVLMFKDNVGVRLLEAKKQDY